MQTTLGLFQPAQVLVLIVGGLMGAVGDGMLTQAHLVPYIITHLLLVATDDPNKQVK